jgi:DnaK suppressor protein
MSKLDKARIRDRLVTLRQELESLSAASDESSQTVELDQSRVGRLSRMDAMQAQAMAKESSRRREDTLRSIADALARLDRDDYGHCQSCDEPIPQGRLEFDPTATLCVRCAEMAEKPE